MNIPVRSVVAGLLLTLSCGAYAADINKGRQTYGKHCAMCHGQNGISVMPGAPNFARTEGLLRPDMQLVESIRTGRNAMPAYMGILSDRDILDVIAYMRTLR